MKKTRLAIIDADSMIYIIAWKFRNKNIPNLVKMSLNSFINDCLTTVGATHYVGFYGSQEDGAEPNFRYGIVNDYKGTRPDTPDFITKWRPIIHAQMKDKWTFQPIDGMEADDAVGIANAEYKNQFDSVVVITSDKDLKQFADTTHFDMSKRIETEMNEFDADLFFSTQMLKGDNGDNIKGLPGIGPKKAVGVLEPCTTSIQLKWTVIRMYKQHFADMEQKIIKTKSKAIETKWMADNSESLISDGFLTKQIQRKARLFVDLAIQNQIKEELPYTWKEYIVQQYRLLRMLDKAPNGFILNPVTEYADATEPKAEIKDIMQI